MGCEVLDQQILFDGFYIRPVCKVADIDVWVELHGVVCVFNGDFDGGGGGGIVVCRDWVDDVVVVVVTVVVG